tara:strand:+ start:1982 stop:2335 length:354 start_codon:yes stop_codon:yes gene_type:complete
MYYFYPVVTGYGPQACHMEDVALGLLIEHLTDKGFELAESYVAWKEDPESDEARVFSEGYLHMRTCLYGEFADSNFFEIAFVNVTNEIEQYESDFHELIAVALNDQVTFRVLSDAIL